MMIVILQVSKEMFNMVLSSVGGDKCLWLAILFDSYREESFQIDDPIMTDIVSCG
ncbi:MAG: hypothetical protein PHI40_06165 [Caldisericia bacterium]|nr:hypothetical protein [Caldisericia bacterium]MDD4614972.1 hypothetical protein [Caldisericia bacterium]